MGRYTRLVAALFRNSLSREAEFRGNFLLWIAVAIFWVLFQLAWVAIIFQYTPTVGGWDRSSIFFLVGYFRLVEGLFHFLFYTNLIYLPEIVNDGRLDLYLTRPISNLFLISCRYFGFDEIATSITGLGIIIWVLLRLPHPLSVWWIPLFVAAVAGSLILFFSLVLILSSLVFYFQRLTAIFAAYDVFTKFLRLPASVVTGSGRLAVSLLIIYIAIITLPSQFLLGLLPAYLVLIQLAVAGIVLFLTLKFWRFTLRRYSSASS